MDLLSLEEVCQLADLSNSFVILNIIRQYTLFKYFWEGDDHLMIGSGLYVPIYCWKIIVKQKNKNCFSSNYETKN